MNAVLGLVNRVPWRYYGVWMLPLCGIMAFAAYGSVLYTWPVFFPVIVKEFGWSAAVAATASSLARMEGGVEGPLVGWVMDKYGPRVVMIIGGLMMGLGLVALHWMDNIIFYYIVFGVIVNLGYNASNYSASYKAVANWWVKWRARATSVMILPTAIAGTFGPSVGTWAIQQWGWRTAVLVMGLLVCALYACTAVFIRPKRPEAYGLLPDGDDPKKVAAAAAAVAEAAKREEILAQATMRKEIDSTTVQAAKSMGFWVWSVASIFSAFAGGVVLLFVPFHLTSRGFDMTTAAFYAGLMMSITYIGRFIVLAVGDVFNPKYMLCIAYVLQGLGCLAIANASPNASSLALAYGLFYGVGYGMSIPLSPTVRGWLFGRQSFGTIGGIVATIAMIGSVTAPTFAGYVFDVSKSYYFAYMAFFAAFVLASVVLVFAKRPARAVVPSIVVSPARS